jgi:hypothetical protein
MRCLATRTSPPSIPPARRGEVDFRYPLTRQLRHAPFPIPPAVDETRQPDHEPQTEAEVQCGKGDRQQEEVVPAAPGRRQERGQQVDRQVGPHKPRQGGPAPGDEQRHQREGDQGRHEHERHVLARAHLARVLLHHAHLPVAVLKILAPQAPQLAAAVVVRAHIVRQQYNPTRFADAVIMLIILVAHQLFIVQADPGDQARVRAGKGLAKHRQPGAGAVGGHAVGDQHLQLVGGGSPAPARPPGSVRWYPLHHGWRGEWRRGGGRVVASSKVNIE